MTKKELPAWKAFIKLFHELAMHRHRYEVFRDFVTMVALSMHNAINKVEALEAEYLAIAGRYSRDDINHFPKLLAHLIELLDIEPWDALGALYMELELSSDHIGQFFTPPEVSELMAKLTWHGVHEKLKRPFVTVQEPACGAGGMVLAFAKVLIEEGHNPELKMWAKCQDVDRLPAMMCYVQLALWNIPGVVIVGNTLAMEEREVFYTPAHYLWQWGERLRTWRNIETMRSILTPEGQLAKIPLSSSASQVEAPLVKAESDTHGSPDVPKPLPPTLDGGPEQFDFGF